MADVGIPYKFCTDVNANLGANSCTNISANTCPLVDANLCSDHHANSRANSHSFVRSHHETCMQRSTRPSRLPIALPALCHHRSILPWYVLYVHPTTDNLSYVSLRESSHGIANH